MSRGAGARGGGMHGGAGDKRCGDSSSVLDLGFGLSHLPWRHTGQGSSLCCSSLLRSSFAACCLQQHCPEVGRGG